jgi:hypothetical protein
VFCSIAQNKNVKENCEWFFQFLVEIICNFLQPRIFHSNSKWVCLFWNKPLRCKGNKAFYLPVPVWILTFSCRITKILFWFLTWKNWLDPPYNKKKLNYLIIKIRFISSVNTSKQWTFNYLLKSIYNWHKSNLFTMHTYTSYTYVNDYRYSHWRKF